MGIEAGDSPETHYVTPHKLGKEIKIVSGKNPELEDSFPHDRLYELGHHLAITRAEAYPEKTIVEHTNECKRDIMEALHNGTLTTAILDDEVVSIGSIHPLGKVKTKRGKPIFMIGRASTITSMEGQGIYREVSNQMMERYNRLYDPYVEPLMSAPHENALEFRRAQWDWKEIDFENPPNNFPRQLCEGLMKDVEKGEFFFIYDPEHRYYPPKE
jgi:hypothetical protein